MGDFTGMCNTAQVFAGQKFTVTESINICTYQISSPSE